MKHRPNPSCSKRLLAANVDRPVAFGEDDAVGVRKLTPTYADFVLEQNLNDTDHFIGC
jgi:hypothetical protein